MTVAIRLTCDAGDCPSYVAIAACDDLGDAPLYMDDDGDFIVETTWLRVPEGWTLEADGKALCPDHAPATRAAP